MKKLMTTAIAVITLLAAFALPLAAMNFSAEDAAKRDVTIYNNGEYSRLYSDAATVQDLLYEVGILPGHTIRTNFAPEMPIWNGMFVLVEEKMPLDVQIDNNPTQRIFVWPGTTVEQVVTQLQRERHLPLIYGGEYTREAVPGETIRLKSWQTRLETETVPLPYQTHENRTNAVWAGHSHIRQAGALGSQEVTTEVIYIGGVEQNREVVGEMTLTKPVDSIIDVGTARLGARADVTAPDFHYRRRLVMEATAYTANYGCTGKHPDDPGYRITASGIRVEHGVVAVDRTVIPLGTRLYVEGYGFAIAADVGGAIRGYRIDLFMENLNEALWFGRRQLYVWILD